LRDIAALGAGGCENDDAINRAVARVKQDAQGLPMDTVNGAKAQRLVDGVLRQTRDTLATCP